MLVDRCVRHYVRHLVHVQPQVLSPVCGLPGGGSGEDLHQVSGGDILFLSSNSHGPFLTIFMIESGHEDPNTGKVQNNALY